MGDAVRILKIDTDKNPDISTQLQVSQSFLERKESRLEAGIALLWSGCPTGSCSPRGWHFKRGIV